MRYPELPARDLVLVGAGHTHLHVVRQWRMRAIPDVQLTLVSPFSRATYSGMLPGTLAGLYQPDQMQIDLYRMTAGTGIRLIIEAAIGLRHADRIITFANRPPIRFDVASIGMGSIPSHPEIWQHSKRVLSIKPMATFLDRLAKAIEDSRQRKASDQSAGYSLLQVVVVGSGAAGTEIAFCLDALLRKSGIRHQLTLLDHHDQILNGYSSGFVDRARKLLLERGIQVRLGRKAARIEELTDADCGRLVLDDGSEIAMDLVIWATSARPPEALAGCDLPKSADGFLAIRQTLQSTLDTPIFAVGDSGTFLKDPVPKAGVYAVREGPILWDNIQRILSNRPLVEYQPQCDFLSLLATGDGRALMQYKGWTAHGQWMWRLKDYIDRKFMRMYQDYRPPAMHAAARSSNQQPQELDKHAQDRHNSSHPPSAMHCGGCGSKLGAEALHSALRRVIEFNPQAGATLGNLDDGFVVPESLPRLDVLSVDFFRAFLDDPYLLGRIAALHALGDLWAMGATPIGVQALVTLPYGPARQQSELLFQILSGAVAELDRNGTAIWGGHTTEGPELQLGFAASGTLNGNPPWRKSGLQTGDVLILTKRLGTGILLAGHQRGLCRAEWMDAAIEVMLQGQSQCARTARLFPISAATDITGFGFVGHLLELLRASNRSAILSTSVLEGCLLAGVRELVEQGVESTLAPANRAQGACLVITEAAGSGVFRSNALDGKSLNPAREEHNSREVLNSSTLTALFDPQTSGGLLLAVPASHTSKLIEQLKTAACPFAVVIGQVTASESNQPKIRLQ